MRFFDRTEGRIEAFDVVLDQLRAQAFLGREVMVNTGFSNADLRRKIGITERGIALGAHLGFRGSQQRRFCRDRH
ncbi:hypothetical protein D3C85_1656960 [compost metagenome]